MKTIRPSKGQSFQGKNPLQTVAYFNWKAQNKSKKRILDSWLNTNNNNNNNNNNKYNNKYKYKYKYKLLAPCFFSNLFPLVFATDLFSQSPPWLPTWAVRRCWTLEFPAPRWAYQRLMVQKSQGQPPWHIKPANNGINLINCLRSG